MMLQYRRWLPLSVLLATLTACGGGGTTPAATPATPTAPPATATLMPTELPSSIPAPAPPGANTGEIPADLLQALIADLAGRLNISTDAISVQSAATVTWNDSSLGCPMPGIMYMQVLIDGYKVVLVATGTAYNYHVGVDGKFVLCEA